eukprot:TRINITY_DN5792_c0_g1_i13.p1 TRINITY_DN5792_c0_g1~~TRINITY_DN5792_c0_g1_i13.p1  ORF type:complete len:152 (+),score=30.19 TRINITY_DN5792_c0_g1_i13:83-538(+)
MDDPSKEKIYWFFLFFAILVARELFKGSRIAENIACWWEKRQNPVVKVVPDQDLESRMKASREKIAEQHMQHSEKHAQARNEEAKKNDEKKLKKMENLEKQINGEEVEDDTPAPLGPSQDNPKRAPYKLSAASCGPARFRPSGFSRRGGGG